MEACVIGKKQRRFVLFNLSQYKAKSHFFNKKYLEVQLEPDFPGSPAEVPRPQI